MSSLALGAAFPLSNIMIPKGGPKTVPARLDFSNTAEIEIDAQAVIDTRKIEYLQNVFIDNADNPATFTLILGVTGQRIVAAPNSQGYYAILAPNSQKMTARTTQQNGRLVTLFFSNVPIQSHTWSTT